MHTKLNMTFLTFDDNDDGDITAEELMMRALQILINVHSR